MIYYKYLELDWQPVANQIKTYILDNHTLIEEGTGSWRLATNWIIENSDIKELFPWDIDFIGIFVTHNTRSSIHIDNDQKPVRINFPILNCENTVTKYYKFFGNTERKIQKNGVSYHNIDISTLEEVDSFNLDKAVLMRVLEPHQVCVNHNNFPRVSCTVQFKQDLEYLLEDKNE